MSSLFECPKVGGKECRIGITLLEQWLIRQSRHKKKEQELSRILNLLPSTQVISSYFEEIHTM